MNAHRPTLYLPMHTTLNIVIIEFTLKKLDKCMLRYIDTKLKSNSEKIYTKIIITVNSINEIFFSIKKLMWTI